MGRDKQSDDELIILDDLFTDNNTTIDLSSIGGGGGSGMVDTIYDPYVYSGPGGLDTITLSGLNDPWTTSVNNDLNVSGDIKVDGVSLKDWMQTVEKRLCILQPKPELMDRYAALQKAYEHYKTLEALLHNADKDDPPPS